MKTRTAAQLDREDRRGLDGKFIKNPCDCCGRGAPMDHFSDERCNSTGGWGVVLHARCAAHLAKLSDEEYAQAADFAMLLRSW